MVFLIVFIIESKETELNETQVNSLKVGGELSSRSQMLIAIYVKEYVLKVQYNNTYNSGYDS